MAFTVRSNSFKDGDYLGRAYLVRRFRLWLRGRKQVPAPCVVQHPGEGRDHGTLQALTSWAMIPGVGPTRGRNGKSNKV